MCKVIASILTAVLLIGPASTAAASQALAGRSALGIQAGLWGRGEASVQVGAATVASDAGGAAGGISYLKWLDEGWALELAATALSESDVEVSSLGDVRSSAADFVAILLGGRRYVPAATYATRLRPYLTAAAGPCIGSQGDTRVNTEVSVEASTQLALAGYAGGGVDVLLGRHLLLGLSTGYLLATAYDPPVGGREDVSGPRFLLGLSWLWGSPGSGD